MRKDFLKGYILAVLAEGGFEGLGPTAIATKAMSIVVTDLPEVLSEMGQVFATQAGHKVGAAVLGRVGDVVRDIRSRGVGAVWSEIKAQYDRGVEVKARARKR